MYDNWNRNKLLLKKLTFVIFTGASIFLAGCGTGSPTGVYCLTCSVDIDSLTHNGGVIGADSNGESDRIKAKQLADSNCQLRGFDSASMAGRDQNRSWRAYYPYACVRSRMPAQVTPDQSNNKQLNINSVKEKCSELGFKPNTEQFGNCVLKLIK
jgi:hypothetical protein